MKKNVGSIDKYLRLVVGVAIGVVGYLNESWWGLVGIVPIMTGFISFCPAYFPFKLSTTKKDNDA
ncbi:MAG: DUF2892 domain-containing protein [Ignavibacteriae bacterium]|nr:DUF2892 domain-containing protein [Ignavibacteriota bacterium]